MIAIGADHGGYKLKEEIKKYLEEKEIDYKDFGTNSDESVHYPEIAKEVSKAVQSQKYNFGILVCRTGFGMAMVANKYKGVRCAPCYNEETAKLARMHNDMNVLAIGADQVSVNEAICILRMALATEFAGGRHQERINLINEIEKENMK